jgi:hypothetical protein
VRGRGKCPCGIERRWGKAYTAENCIETSYTFYPYMLDISKTIYKIKGKSNVSYGWEPKPRM